MSRPEQGFAPHSKEGLYGPCSSVTVNFRMADQDNTIVVQSLQ